MHLPIGTRLEETDKTAKRIEGIFKQEVPESIYYFSRSGQVTGIGRTFGQASGTHIISAGTKLVPKLKRRRSVKEIGQIVRKKNKEYTRGIKDRYYHRQSHRQADYRRGW